MTLYSCNISNIKRGEGASSVGKSAYNSRSRLEDIRTGKIYDNSRKKDLGFSEIIAPECAPNWVKDRQQLWAENELANKRRDARVAKEILVALPRELDTNEQLHLVRKFVTENLTPLGVVADVNAHELDPSLLPSHERDRWNPHCHILISTQHIESGSFGKKITQLNQKDFVLQIRKAWAEATNSALEAAGIEKRVDHRSYRVRGINRIPQIHLGHRVWAMKEKGIATDRGELYQEIEERNQEIETINKSVSTAIESAQATRQKLAPEPEREPEIAHNPQQRDRQQKPEMISGLEVVRRNLPPFIQAQPKSPEPPKKSWLSKATSWIMGEDRQVDSPTVPEKSIDKKTFNSSTNKSLRELSERGKKREPVATSKNKHTRKPKLKLRRTLFNRDSDSERFGKALIENQHRLEALNQRFAGQKPKLYLSADETHVIINTLDTVNQPEQTVFMMMPDYVGGRLKVKIDRLTSSDYQEILKMLDEVIKAERRKQQNEKLKQQELPTQSNHSEPKLVNRFEKYLARESDSIKEKFDSPRKSPKKSTGYER